MVNNNGDSGRIADHSGSPRIARHASNGWAVINTGLTERNVNTPKSWTTHQISTGRVLLALLTPPVIVTAIVVLIVLWN